MAPSAPALGLQELAPGVRGFRLGQGPPIVWLHGLLGWAEQWSAAAAPLAADHTCWLLELPGIGVSRAVPDSSLAGLAAWLADAVAALGFAQFDLVGASWGGAVALQFASVPARAARLRRLALAAPANPFWRPSRRQRFMLTPSVTRLAAAVGARLPDGVCRALLATNFGDPAVVTDERVAQYRAVLARPGLGAAVANAARHWRRDQDALRALLPAVTVPTLLVWGDRDWVVPVASAQPLRQALPQAELTLLPGLGHLPFEENPAAFTALLRRFLT